MKARIMGKDGHKIANLNREKAILERCLNCKGWYPKEGNYMAPLTNTFFYLICLRQYNYNNLEDIPLMYAKVGKTHPGWAYFIFKRDLYPRFMVGQACIGTDWIGRMMIANMAALAKRFKAFKDLQMTFHIGDEPAWKTNEFADCAAHNKEECRKYCWNLMKNTVRSIARGFPEGS